MKTDKGLRGLYLKLKRLTVDPVFPETPSAPQVTSEGGVAFKFHYGVLSFLSNFHKQIKSDSGNGTIRACYHQSQIFDDQAPQRTQPGVSLSK